MTSRRLFGRATPVLLLPALLALASCDDAPSSVETPATADARTRTRAPGKVTDLSVAGTDAHGATLTFTQVADGAGGAASYQLRYAPSPMGWGWGGATVVSEGSCASPLAGTAAGQSLTCTVAGLEPETAYDVQIVAFRGTLGSDAVFGSLSAPRSFTTAAEGSGSEPGTLTVAPDAVTLDALGATFPLSVEALDASGAPIAQPGVSWSSLDPSVAGVGASGVVTAAAPGATSVVASAACCTPDTVRVTVAPAVASVSVTPAQATLAPGGSTALSARATDANGNEVAGAAFTWASSATGVATVDGSGRVTAVAEGSATVTATSDGVSGSSAVTVEAAPAPTGDPGTVADLRGVSSASDSVVMRFTQVGDGAGGVASYQLRYAPSPIGWGWGGATVVSEGSCASPLAGTKAGATLTCSVAGLQPSTSYDVQIIAFRGTLGSDAVFGDLSEPATVTTAGQPAPQPASVTVSPSSLALEAGQTGQLGATVRDASGAVLSGATVTWTSSDAGVATVNGNGRVTAVAAGPATVTATSGSASGSASVSVASPPPPPPSGGSVDTLFVEDFESGSLSAFQDGVNASKHQIRTDASVAAEGSRYLDITYQNEEGGWLTRFLGSGHDSLYVSAWVQLAPGWEGETKILAMYGSRRDNVWSAFGKAGVCPNGTDFFAAMIRTYDGSPGPLGFYTYYPDMSSAGGCYGSRGDGTESYTPNAPSVGTWHFVEFFVKLNTPGQGNAVQEFWLDGVKTGSWSGFSFRDSTILELNSVQITANATASSRTRHMYVDDLVVLSGRPGGR